MSCYIWFFNVRRGWQSLNTEPRFYLRLIRRTGWLLIYTSCTTNGCPFKPKKLSVPFLYPGVAAGLAPFRGLVHLGRRNLVPILPPAHPLGGGITYVVVNSTLIQSRPLQPLVFNVQIWTIKTFKVILFWIFHWFFTWFSCRARTQKIKIHLIQTSLGPVFAFRWCLIYTG